MIASVKAFQEDLDKLKKAVESIDSAHDFRGLTSVDTQIGTILHSLQYGVGRMAIEIKKHVDEKKVSL